jgi:MoxR-like ATPase
LRRRCLYHWIEYPEAQRAVEILRRTVPSSNDQLLRSASEFVGRVRALELDKPPGMAETIDWVSALSVLGVTSLGRSDVVRTLGAITKTVDDRLSVLTSLADMGLDEEVALEH